MVKNQKVEWKFPSNKFFFMKIEIFSIAIIAVVVFFISFLQIGGSYLLPTIVTAAFVVLYGVISYLIQRLRQVEEKYLVTKTHFQVSRKVRNKVTKEKVHLGKVKLHKLDRFFLGGYLVTEKGKHLLFFNTIKELENFEKHLKKHMKKR